MATVGSLLGRPWLLLGRSWPLLGRSWAALGRSWAALGRSWPALGCSWAAPGRSKTDKKLSKLIADYLKVQTTGYLLIDEKKLEPLVTTIAPFD